MIPIKTTEDIKVMKKSCQLAADVLVMIEEHIRPGISTLEINDICHRYIVEHDAVPSPLNYNGFPKSICTSINHVVCHGIPSAYILKEGDIINVDVTAFINDFHGDTSKTFSVGKTSRASRDIVSIAEEALWEGIRAVRPNGNFGDIGFAVQSFVENKGYSVVREYGGHGIGRAFHEDPHVTHFGRKGSGPKFLPGMVFTVEPMINQGKRDVILLDDDWTVETADGKLSAQFEHTIVVHEESVEILTLPSNSTIDPFVWKK